MRREVVAAAIVLWAAALLVPAALGDYWTNVAILTVMWIHLCTAWNVVGGIAGQMSFGNAAFFGIGAYTSTQLAAETGLSPWLGMLAGSAIAVVAALVVGAIPFRRGLSHLVFALVTLAFDFALLYLVSGTSALGGVNGLFTPVGASPWEYRFADRQAWLLTITALATALLLVTGWLHDRRPGFVWRAIRDNEPAAAAAGINLYAAKQRAFALSAGTTALAGTFYAQYVGFIDPESVFGIDLAVQMVLFTVVGGIGTLLGPVVGPALLVPFGEILRTQLAGQLAAGANHLAYGIALIVVLLLLPQGLVGLLDRSRRSGIPALVPPRTGGAPAVRAAAPGSPLLVAEGVSKRFGGLQALRDVSFTVREREIFGVIGPNGAGKTTLFSVLSGFLPPSGGRVTFGGRRIDGLAPHLVCALGMARTFQITQPFRRFTAFETVLVAALVRHGGARAHDVAAAALERVGLGGRGHVPSASLTLAEQRRLEIARALATGPRLLLLDEVMAGLTPVEVQEAVALIASLRDEGMTIVVIEHVIRAVMRLCDRVLVLDAGEAVAVGSPAEIVVHPRVIEAYLGAVPTGTPERESSGQSVRRS